MLTRCKNETAFDKRCKVMASTSTRRYSLKKNIPRKKCGQQVYSRPGLRVQITTNIHSAAEDSLIGKKRSVATGSDKA